jgi:hypothetical protein
MFGAAKILLTDQDRFAPRRVHAAGRAPHDRFSKRWRVGGPRTTRGGRGTIRSRARLGARLSGPLQFDEPARCQHEENEK